MAGSPKPYEDFSIIQRHLAGPVSANDGKDESDSAQQAPQQQSDIPAAPAIDDDEFSSLRLQGGDVHREIYRRTEAETLRRGRPQRSQSVFVPKTTADDDDPDAAEINQPGGFRRDHLRRQLGSPGPSNHSRPISVAPGPLPPQNGPNFLTNNFYEFLSLYGHFAGEDVDDDDDDDETESQFSGAQREGRDEGEADERDPLLGSRKRRKERQQGPKKGTAGTVLILLKSFVGTGVLFLPRAFLNGGMAFSIGVMIAVSALSYYCFLLLTTSRLKLKASFAQMGQITYGRWMRGLINSSLVISQVGFASAYIVFTSENLRAFVLAVSKCETDIPIQYMILMQLVIFMPLALYRNLNNISFIVYIADIFIVLGLIYLYYFHIGTVIENHGRSDFHLFNAKSWTLFIGTAIFTFEGIGLIIPIQDGMKKPSQLPSVLGGVMVIITIIFVSMGALAYWAFGSKTETVIILNMPQDNKFVNGLQFIYSLAILLSTPMQIFPAITIMEKGLFKKRSGKFSSGVKWRKNIFRFCVVMAAAFIAWVGANDLDKFVALVGSFACIPLVYIYPVSWQAAPGTERRAHANRAVQTLIHQKAVAERWWERVIDWLLCLLGLVLMAYTTVITISSWIGGEKEVSHGYCDKS